MITIDAIGGLCNRMLAVAATYALARELNQEEIRVIWHPDSGLRARFDDLFEPIADHDVKVEFLYPGDLEYALKYMSPRKSNMFLSMIYQRLRFEICLCSVKKPFCYDDDGEKKLVDLLKGYKDVFITCYCEYFTPAKELYGKLFVPRRTIQEKIKEVTSRFPANTWGVHIRRTDHELAISNSPTELFVKRMDEQYCQDQRTKFYVATDDADVLAMLTDKFKDAVICNNAQVTRSTLEGMIDAVVDLYALSRTKKVLGSSVSSFSVMSHLLSGVELEQLKKQHE